MRLSRTLAAAGIAAAAAVGGTSCASPGEGAPEDPPAAGAGPSAAPPPVVRDPATGVCEARLPNGLKILVLEKPGIPVVSHWVWYRVGSVDEAPGETGLAHYLEHVMFKGTRHVAKGAIDRITFVGGGSNNAYTWVDSTAYYFDFEASRWRLALEIEADRMRNCAFVPAEFEAERGAVLNEMHAGHDAPAGRLDEEVDAAGYLVHPYHHPVIGWQQEIESVPRSTVISFYDRHYMPNNAVLVVSGAVKAEEVVAAAAEAFADVEAGPLPPPVSVAEPPQRGERRFVHVEDTDVPRLMAAWHTCRVGDDDDFVLDVLLAVLGQGRSSRLHRRLVERDRTCTSVSAWSEARKYPGRLKVWADGQEGADPRAIEAAIHEEVARLVAEGPTAREMEKARNNLLAHDLFNRETAHGTAERLGQMEAERDWRVFAAWPDRIRAVTAEDVKRVGAKYLVPGNRTVGWSVSPAQAALFSLPGAAPAPAGEPAPPPGAAPAGGEGEGPAMARKSDPPAEPDARPTFRGGRPRAPDLEVPAGTAGPVRIAPRVERLPNGLTVLLQRHGTLPVTAFDLHLPAGMLVEAKPGVAALVGDLLDDGAGERSAEQIAETVDFLGATLATDATGARVRCLSKDADAVLDLLADVVLRPRFEASEFEKAVRTHLTELAAEDENPLLAGRKAFLKAVYGDHPYGRRPNGDPATLRTVTREEVAAHHAKWFVPDRAILAVAGDFDPGAMLAAVEKRFGSWKPGGAEPPALPAPPAIAATVRIDVPMEGKTQSNVHIGSLAIRRTDPDYAALLVLDHVLGTAPGFSDRLSRDLRDEKGLAYSVWGNATRSAAEEPGTWTGYIACLGDDLPRAVEGILGHMRRIRDEPVSPGELEDAKSYLVGSQVFRYETTEQVAAELVLLQRFGLGFDYPARFPELVGAITREDVQRVARKYLRPDACAIVVSGYVGK